MARTRLQEGTLTPDAAAELQHAFERQERRANRADEKQVGGGRGVTPGQSCPTEQPSSSATPASAK